MNVGGNHVSLPCLGPVRPFNIAGHHVRPAGLTEVTLLNSRGHYVSPVGSVRPANLGAHHDRLAGPAEILSSNPKSHPFSFAGSQGPYAPQGRYADPLQSYAPQRTQGPRLRPLNYIDLTDDGPLHPPNIVSSGVPAAPPANDNTRIVRTLIRTAYCGQVTAAPANPPPRQIHANHQDRSLWRFYCCNCNEVFRDHRAVFTHFPGCVERRGNLIGACWFDHESIERDKIPESLVRFVNVSYMKYFSASLPGANSIQRR